MPRGDGTGPMGYGPMTGRGAGYCAAFNVPGFANPGGGRGAGRGYGRGVGAGRGFGRGRGFARGVGFPVQAAPVYSAVPSQVTPEEEASLLEEEIKLFKTDLDAMEKRLAELKVDK